MENRFGFDWLTIGFLKPVDSRQKPNQSQFMHQDKGIALELDAGVDRTVVSKIERGVTNPSLEILLRLANYLNVEVGQLHLSPDE